MLLDSIVGEMYIDVVEVLRVVLLAAGPDVAFLEEVQLHVMGDQCPNAHVKFPVVDEKRALNVFLQHKG